MPTAWFIVPYKRKIDEIPHIVRYCEMDDYTPQIFGEGGNWTETEVLGDRAVVKVKATAEVLAMLNAVPGFTRLPKDRLDDSLFSLTTNQKNALRNLLTGMGYSLGEIQDRFGDDLGQYTLKDVLKFMATRRRKPRYDAQTDAIILDGDIQSCRPIESLDGDITDA